MKTILVDAVGVFVSEDGVVDTNLFSLLEKYTNKKIILTNADYEDTNKYNLNNLPYEVFTLKHNPDKVDPDYFQKMLEHFGLKADGCVYFEHSPEAVKSAESVGILTHYYDEQKRDLDSLKNFLDSNL